MKPEELQGKNRSIYENILLSKDMELMFRYGVLIGRELQLKEDYKI